MSIVVCTADLKTPSHRERVLAVKTKEHLALLYDEFA
jgi:hypothetical protein